MNNIPDFYMENPYKKPIDFALSGAAEMDDTALHALFVKNLIAWVYFNDHTFKHYERKYVMDDRDPIYVGQLRLFRLYQEGSLVIGKNDPCSPFEKFVCNELVSINHDDSPDVRRYCSYLRQQMPLFHRIDFLSDQKGSTDAGLQFLSFLSAYHIIHTHVNLAVLGDLLEKYYALVCEKIAISYIHHFDESGFLLSDLDSTLQAVFVAMKFDLLEPEEQKELVAYSKRWLTQRFKDCAYAKEMTNPINTLQNTRLFDAPIHYFSNYFSSILNLALEVDEPQKSFPISIFTSYEGYLLFDTLAQQLTVKTTVSYVYRLLFEKGYINAKDTPFQEWFNEQGYPIQLHSATETLLNSKSADREQFVELISKLLNVTI